VTLIRGGDAGQRLRGASVFMTPTVAHLAMVLTLSAFAAVPGLTTPQAGAIFGLCALTCLTFTGRALVMLVTESVKSSHWSDIWSYGAAPFAASLLLAGSAAAVWLNSPWAAYGIAASLVVMLLIAIRNAWDLVTWITAKGDTMNRPEG
jgi:hypothetical protein